MASAIQPGPLNGFLWTSVDTEDLARTPSQLPGALNQQPLPDVRQSLVLGGVHKDRSILDNAREFGNGVADAAAWYVRWSVPGMGMRLGELGADIFEHDVRDLRQNLQIIDEKLLQKNVLTQIDSELVKQLYQSILADYADPITQDCIVGSSTLQCVGTTSLNLGLSIANALDPFTYAKVVAKTYVTVLRKREVISEKWADILDGGIEIAFFLPAPFRAISKISNLRKSINNYAKIEAEADEAIDGIQALRNKLKGAHDVEEQLKIAKEFAWEQILKAVEEGRKNEGK
jgi:hypothetical protein